ncbi:MAG: helix-turn-helix domain-containing protein [Bacteroidota bacterium]
MISIINVLIAYGACQAFFIAFTLLKSDNNKLFRNFFSLLLIIEGIILFERLLVETGLINQVPHLLGISYPISFLKPPLMLFMALAITVRDFKWLSRMYLHLFPFILMLLLNLPFYFLSGMEKIEITKEFMQRIPSYHDFGFYFSISFFLYIGIYIYYSIKKLELFRSQVTNNLLVNWYRIILISYSVFLVLHLIYFLIQPIWEFSFGLINQVSMLAMAFIIQAVAFKLIDKSVILNAKTPNLRDPKKSKIDEQLIFKKLDKEKLYLDDSLTLKAFADALSLPQAYVTELINQRFNCTFKRLINRYRLNEAKRIIQNTNSTKVKLIDVAYESGFNNKVSFYRVFKEFEGISPSEYLEKLGN